MNVYHSFLKFSKVLLFIITPCFFSLLLLEIGITTISNITHKDIFYRQALRQKLTDSSDYQVLGASVKEMKNWATDDIIHPYLGFVRNPDLDTSQSITINEYGFPGENPIQKKSSDKVIIGLFGGSMAEMYYLNKEILINELKSRNIFPGRTIVAVLGGLGGYKQPQQLLALNYFLTLGGQFDVIINLDGFNEIALPFGENWSRHLSTIYPRSWNIYTQKTLSKSQLMQIARLESLAKEKADIQKIFSDSFLKNSILFLNIWNYIDNQKSAEINQLSKIVQASFDEASKSKIRKNYSLEENEIPKIDEAVKIWENSSLQIMRLSEANGIRYFHFLQPNQYVKSSKEFTQEEIKFAVSEDENFPYKLAVEAGYNKLSGTGRNLALQGVNFNDLTMVFGNEKIPFIPIHAAISIS